MAKQPISRRGVSEEPKFSIPDRHAPKGDGTMRDGSPIENRVYKQPWVERDGVTDPQGDAKIG